VENLLLKTPYKFKKSYGGTPEPQTAQDAPWLRGPSLKNENSPWLAPDEVFSVAVSLTITRVGR
jgi:hypothetical protein